MTRLTPQHLIVLVLLTLFWGVNWPIMKLAVSEFPPLSFRALSMVVGLPALAFGLKVFKVPFAVPRRYWPELAKLTISNMVIWHVCLIIALPYLSSGRAAILAYTMPVFSALWGLALFGDRLTPRQTAGIVAAGLGVVLLLWHEFGKLSGAPLAAATVLFASATWALGTQQLRRTRIELPTLTIAFWMTTVTTVVMSLLAVVLEAPRWHAPSPTVIGAIAYNGVLIFGFCHAAWFFLARTLPPVASSISVMLIPILGVLSGTVWLREALHWQDGAAIVLILLSIGAILWPSAPAVPASQRMPAGS